MFSTTLTLNAIHDCLSGLPPVDLLGMRLMQTQPVSGLFPTQVAREQLVAAVSELVAYGTRCRQALSGLRDLSSVPLTTLTLEYGL